MQKTYDITYITNLISMWQTQSKNEFWLNKKESTLSALNELGKTALDFNEEESDFLLIFYTNFSDGNPRSTKILELGEKYNHAEYFFIKQFFDNNIMLCYNDFIFKDAILTNKDVFEGQKDVCVSDVLKGKDKDIISLYVFIENIAKHYNEFCNDREKKDIFKKKLIKFYSSLYKLFLAGGDSLLKGFFNLVLHNQPFIFVELTKKCYQTDSFDKINTLFSDENALNCQTKDGENFEIVNGEILSEFVSLISIKNEAIRSCVLSKKSKEIFESIFGQQINDFASFCVKSKEFVTNFTPYPDVALSDEDKYLYSSLFFNYMNSFEEELSGKNIIYYGPIGTGKTQKVLEVLNIKNPKNDKFRFVSFHKNYKYEDVIDGFVGDKFVNGEFKQLCIEAMKNPEEEYYFIVDNINTVDLNDIFGEAIDLIANKYDEKLPNTYIRSKNSHIIDSFDDAQKEKYSVLIKDGYSYFAVPKNLFIIGSIRGYNGFDKIYPSIISGFEWIKLECNYNLIQSHLTSKGIKNAMSYAKLCKTLNNYITNDLKLGQYSELGHNIYMAIEKYNINGLIGEYHLTKFFDEHIEPILRSLAGNNQEVEQEITRYIKVAKDIFKL